MQKKRWDRIYHWTSGQPYLSQKLARAVARDQVEGDIEETVDRLAVHQLAGRAAITSEPHMSHLHRAVVNDKKNYEALLTIYGQIRKGISIEYDPESPRHRRLLALGLVVADDEGKFRIRNRLYESVFTASWANENLPLHWRGPCDRGAGRHRPHRNSIHLHAAITQALSACDDQSNLRSGNRPPTPM